MPLEDLAINPPSPNFTESDIRALQQLSENGGPLWKLVKSLVDFADHLKEHIAASDLSTEEGLKSARQLQLKRTVAIDTVNWIAQVINKRTAPNVTEQPSSGNSNVNRSPDAAGPGVP